MIETTSTSVTGKITPDFTEVKKSGAVFEWTWNDVKALNEEHQLLMRRRVLPKAKRAPQRMLMFWYWLTVLGGLISFAIVLDILRGDTQSASYSIVAGMILGATSVGITCFVCILIRAQIIKSKTPVFRSVEYRVGVDRGSLWLFDQQALRVMSETSAFDSVIEIGDVIVAYVNQYISFVFPRTKLNQTAAGKEVISWFETYWPNHTGENAFRYRVLRESWIRRVSRKIISAICVIGFLVFIISIAIHASDLWHQNKADESFTQSSTSSNTKIEPAGTPSDRNYNSHSLSGPAAKDFLDHLTHPTTK